MGEYLLLKILKDTKRREDKNFFLKRNKKNKILNDSLGTYCTIGRDSKGF